MKKRLLSLLLSLLLLLSLVPATALAASGNISMTVSPSTGTMDTLHVGDTVTVTVSNQAMTVSTFTFNVQFDKDKFECTSIVGADSNYPDEIGLEKESGKNTWAGVQTKSTLQEANNTAAVGFGWAAAGDTKYKAATIVTITFKVKATGSAKFVLSEDSGGTNGFKGEVSSTSATILKAPITSVSFTLNDPAKGAALPSLTALGSGYTGAVEWYEGKNATGTAVIGNAKPNQVYTAKITLKADTSAGESFANSVTFPTGYTKVSNDGTKLVLTKTFPATAAKDTPVITTLPTAGSINYDQMLYKSSLSGGEAKVGSTVVPGSFKWKEELLKPEVKDSNATEYEVVFKPNDTTSYETTTCKVKLTVNKKTLTNLATTPISDQPYTGSPITPTFNVMNGKDFDEILDPSDYKVIFTNNTNVGTANYTIKETPTGNYEFNTSYGTFKIKKADSTISITGDPSKTYDGYVVNDPAVNKSGSTGAVTYTYYTDAACTTKTTTASGAASDGAAPKNAGDYWVKATLAADSNHDSATSVAKKFTISQKDLTDDMITLGTQATYDGTAHGPVYSAKDGTTVLTKGIDYTEISGYNSVTNVGNTTLKISGTGNYKGTAQKDWSLVAKDVTITPDAKSKTYGAADPELTYSTDLTAGSALETAFNTAKSGALSYTGTDVGAYIIGIGTLKAGNNFNLKMNATAVFFTINQATPVITATTPRQLVNNGVEVDISDWASFTNTDSDAKLTYTLGSAPAGITLAGNKLKAASSVAAGATFEIKVNAYGTHNFTAPTEFTIHVTVVNKKDAGVSITTPPTSKTYGDANFTVTATKTAPDGGTWKWTSTDDTVLKIVSGGDSATATVQVLKASATGATLTVTYTSDTHYGSASAAITVAQKEVTISGITAANKEYDGSTTATPTGTAVINGKVGSDDVTVTAGTATFADKNVGTGKTVTFTGYSLSGADAGNYNLKAQPASVTANITAKVVKLTGGINATDRSYVKDNKTVDLTKGTLTFDGLVSGETLDVNIPTTGTISNAKVGTYNVTYSGVTLKDGTTGKASNYKLVSPLPTVTVNITKASAPALSDIPVSQKYNVTTGEKAIGAVMPADAGTLTYTKSTESKTGSVTVTSWAVDATGKVTYTLSGGKVNDTVTLPVIIGSDNYADATVNVVITIIKATPTGEPAYTKITTSGKTLNDAALTTTGSTLNPNAGTLVWVDNAGNVLPDTTAVAANTTYKWRFTPADANYESISGTIKLWSKSSGGSGSYYPAGITFTTDLPVGTINRVAVNGKTLDTKNYVVNGSDVTLLQSYLDTLKAGKYTVKIENKTHVSTGTFTIKADGTLSSPRTADAGVCLYAAMALMSGTGAAYVTLRRKKEN